MFLSMETINSWCHPLAPAYTCQSKEFVPRGRRAWTSPSIASLQDLCPCSWRSSQPQPGRGFSLGFPNSPPSFPVRPSLASNLQGTKTQLFPRLGGEDPFTSLLHGALSEDSGWAVEFVFLPARVHLRSADLYCWQQHICLSFTATRAVAF